MTSYLRSTSQRTVTAVWLTGMIYSHLIVPLGPDAYHRILLALTGVGISYLALALMWARGDFKHREIIAFVKKLNRR